MQTAYLVRRKADSFLYVMKKLVLEQLGEKEAAEAENECQVLSKLRNHLNIVKVVEYFKDEGRLCIVMEYADGGDLNALLKSRNGALLREHQVLDYFVQVCLAMKHVHDRKVLHRDIKSANIFLTHNQTVVKLGDFGIAHALNSTMELARTACGAWEAHGAHCIARPAGSGY